ncbi:MAG: hypothetical protein ACJ73N_13460 [Bryobacteraceae bacterium]
MTQLAEWSRSSGLNPRDHVADAEILSDGFGVDQLHYLERLTTAVIAANNKSAVGAPLLH